MRFKNLIILLLFPLCLGAQHLGNQSWIELLSCAPGRDAYARYGHTAIRVCDPEIGLDWVFNYGLFDFYSEDFYWKFVKGETYYMLGAQGTPYFYHDYRHEKRAVYAQELNFNLEQRQALLDTLLWNIQPENRYYLYNFVFDNCATRPYHLIKAIAGDSLCSDYVGLCGITFRDAIRQYTDRNSWVSVGINLVFGPKADRPMTNEERLFLPEELMNYASNATTNSGAKIVNSEHTQPFVHYKTPWYAIWWWQAIVLFLLMVALSVHDRKQGKLSIWADCVIALIYILLIGIVFFLTFFSIHPLVGFGWRLLLIPALHLCARLPYIVH